MKIVGSATLFVILFLSACQQESTLSISEVEFVPDHIQEAVQSDERIQFVQEEAYAYYIAFRAAGSVEAGLETEDDTLFIQFEETESASGAEQQYVYFLTTEPEHEVLDVQVNGESVPIDQIIVTDDSYEE